MPGSAAPKSVRVPFRVVPARASESPVCIPVPTPVTSGPRCNVFLESERTLPLSMRAELLKSAPPDDIEVALALSLNGRLTPYVADDHPAAGLLEDSSLSFVRELPDAERTPSDIAKRHAVPVYAITRGKDSIARMYLPKRRLLLGDNISAVFYFDADKPCLQLGARLEMHEIIKPEHSLGTKEDASKGTVFRKVYGEHGEFVMMNRNTHVTFSIPYDAPASFATDVVEIRWLIHFVFLIAQQPRKLRAERLATASSTVLDDHEATRLLDHLDEDDALDSDEEVEGWTGGAWRGENVETFRAIPRGDVDVLRWTLPIVITGTSTSPQWGLRYKFSTL